MKKKIISFILIFVAAIYCYSLVNQPVQADEDEQASEANNSVVDLFEEYYNNGVYSKDTVIYFNEATQKEVVKYFHAQHVSCRRTTYYSGDKLWFSYGSGYGSKEGKLTHFEMVDGKETNEYVISNLPAMEEYYLTLNDFVEGKHISAHTNNVEINLADGWTYENGVYTSESKDVLDGYRLFVAPTWIGLTDANKNYADFTKATVEEVGQTLVMKLWVHYETEKGKLVENPERDGENGPNAVFAKAIVVKDTNVYNLYNGGFEEGSLDGWTKVGQIGNVHSADRYWNEGINFNKDGNYLFSTYADDNESAHGYLKSSNFVVGGSGWITFKLGAMKNASYMNFQVVDANTGEILKVYGNPFWKDSDFRGCELVPYKAYIGDLLGREVYVRALDYAGSDYGCIQLDSVFTYYTSEPADYVENEPVLEDGILKFTYTGYHLAEDIKAELYEANTIYEVPNAGFEKGNADGWYKFGGNIGNVSSANTYWAENVPFNKDGEYFFSNYEGGNEGHRGYLSTRPFIVGGTGWITFKLGGGRNAGLVNVQIINTSTGEILKAFGNTNWTDADCRGCQMNAYKADISEFMGQEVYIRVVDAATNNYGVLFFDSLDTYHLEQPGDEYAVSTPVDLYNVINGGFESGTLNGSWEIDNWNNGSIGTVTDKNWYWPGEGERLNQDGTYLFNYYHPFEGDNHEWCRGTLTSSAFVVSGSGYVTYKLGAAGRGDDNNRMYVRVIDAITGEELKRVVNSEYYTHGGSGQMLSYKFDLTQFKGRYVQVQFVDDSDRDYGCFIIDSLVTYYDVEPDGFYYAENFYR